MGKSQTKYHITDQERLKEVLFHDYQIIKNQMKAPLGNKIKMLSTLFSINPNSWRVVGITTAALEIFNEKEFKKVSKMGINRSHLIQRHTFYEELLSSQKKLLTQKEFWEEYHKKDMTVLSTSSENMKKESFTLEKIIHVPNDDRELFRTSGYAWKHKEAEEKFLQEIYLKLKNKEPLQMFNQSDDYII